MSLHRFFLTGPLLAGADAGSAAPFPLPLAEQDVHHVTRVLRLGPGAVIVVVEPGGAAWRVRLVSAGLQGCIAEDPVAIESPRLPHVTLMAAVAKGDKIDLVVEKAVEIGVERIVPVLTERSVVRLTAEKAAARGERWRRVAEAAAKQSQRASVPVVTDPEPLDDVAARIDGHDIVLVAWEEGAATAPGIGEALDELGASADSTVALVVGPEGGLTAREVYELERRGARAVSLGSTVLRAETAGVVAAALVIYELGGLRGRQRA